MAVAGIPGFAAAQGTEDQRFRLLFNADPTQEPGKVVAQGPISGPGVVRVTSVSSSGLTAVYEFKDGSVLVAVTFVDGSFDADARSCTAVATSVGEIEITGGTGAYEGASGTGVATGTARYIGQRGDQGECRLDLPPARGLERVLVETTLDLEG